MHLKRFTDLGLRILMHLANEADPDKTHSVPELSEILCWNQNLVIKTAHAMVKAGWLEAVRGRNGGLRLACKPEDLRIGDVVRTLEDNDHLVDCGEPPCPFAGKCVLVGALRKAQEAFYDELNRLTLADLRQGGAGQVVSGVVSPNLEEQGSIELQRSGRKTLCRLKELHAQTFTLKLDDGRNRDEMQVYIDRISPLLNTIGPNAEHILEFCFTEMFNNVLDHSGASEARIELRQTAISTTILLIDNGVGIFKKIKNALGLPDERQSLLELSKGKFTTDPENHTGEGIFFSSRACSRFVIFSNGLIFTHSADKPRDLLTRFPEFTHLEGTLVEMTVNNNTATKLRSIFDRFATVDGGFRRTEVPVKLLQYKNEGLVSRSQAKRLLARVENFKFVTFDFEGIPTIGQAFADQIFRVFANAHPEVTIDVKNVSKDVLDAIEVAKNNAMA